jgi:hypothetical protein
MHSFIVEPCTVSSHAIGGGLCELGQPMESGRNVDGVKPFELIAYELKDLVLIASCHEPNVQLKLMPRGPAAIRGRLALAGLPKATPLPPLVHVRVALNARVGCTCVSTMSHKAGILIVSMSIDTTHAHTHIETP